jgi:galactose mutarotase-like enzyme
VRVELAKGGWRASVDSLGAEPRSLVDAATGREYLWQADPAWWKGTAPILFPIVGGLRNGAYRHGGREYRLGQHGFARGSEFELEARTEDGVQFRLTSSPATRESYPFEWSLCSAFSLEDTGFRLRCTLTNEGSFPLPFSIGFHPAFNLPFAGPGGGGSLESYYLLFERAEAPERLFFKDGLLVAGKKAEVFENSRVVSLTRSLFDEGPVIIERPASREFKIVHGPSGKHIAVKTEALAALALWSKPGAPFLCVEPWQGLPDSTEASGELEEKPGIMMLEPRGAFSTGYSVEIG